MLQSNQSKLKKIQKLLTPSTLTKEIASSAKTAYTKLGKCINLKNATTAYTKLGKHFNLKDAIGAIRLKDTYEDANESSFYCPNEKCGHVFKRPLVALQIQEDEETKFYACPRCLSEITVADDSMLPDVDELEDDGKEESENEQVLAPEASSGCHHHYGYLGERDSNAVIPEECMICKDLMSCMHKKVKK